MSVASALRPAVQTALRSPVSPLGRRHPGRRRDTRIGHSRGVLQSEFGCAGELGPACSATLPDCGRARRGRAPWTLPAGSYEFKVTINDAWTENYMAPAEHRRRDILITVHLARPKLTFTTTRSADSRPPLAGGGQADPATRPARNSLAATGSASTSSLADRFANGSTANDKGGL